MIKRLSTVSILYLAQAIPLYFCTFALPTILRAEQVSLEKIGLLSTVLLPWVIKFLWAPYVDKHYLPALGKRRSWILPLQFLSTGLLVCFALLHPMENWWLIFTLSFLLSTVSATQDIAIDGFNVEQFSKDEHRYSNLARVLGTTFGSMVGGALLITFYKTLGWENTAYYIAAVCVMIIIPMIFIREKPTETSNHNIPSLKHFWQRATTRDLLILCLVYRACEGLVMGMQQSFLVDLELPLSMIGIVMGVGNTTIGLAGAFAASYFLKPLGTKRALLMLGMLRTICYFSLAAIAITKTSVPSIVFSVVLVNMASRLMEMVVLYTIFMEHCSKEQAGTDFTVLVCAELLIYLSGMSASGFLAANLGYGLLFAGGGLLSIPGFIGALWILRRLNKRPESSRSHDEPIAAAMMQEAG